ncbi:glycoside hydrolase family 3 protein [Myriangium duriaei CBS 260.36]|uniref:Probable beta-glucosidase E n=1 Tax=Myriangium duriaei CBS 260.36 TaxID=1168546 RepID=A0A9P4JCM5_9PEZI|nr:glycoside hydrolase family 3 protein [Myriangium duriaei CBS 260.36]
MPDTYELDKPLANSSSASHDTHLESPDDFRMSLESSSSRSSIDSATALDPLKHDIGPYRDNLNGSSNGSLRSLFDSEKLFRPRRAIRVSMPSCRMCCCAVCGILFVIFLLLSAGGYWAVKVGGVPPDGLSEPWYPSPRGGTIKEWVDSYKKASELVKKMELVEKVNITTGTGWKVGPCVGNTGSVPRLNFPALCLQDGPLGLRFTDHTTAFPAGITVGAGWNKTAMYFRGRAHALEARGKGINVILGPSMGPLGRLPAGGRNWEGFGSDPVLAGVAAFYTIKGIQDQGVMATAKHFVGNEQEHFRQSWEWGTPNAISSNIDDRTLHELYAWPFGDSIRAGVASIMCSYNQVNNSYACQNSKLMNGILKDELGFQGFIQSDWLAQRSGVASALAGLDMTMPGDGLIWQNGHSLWGPELTKAVLNGTVPVERLDDMVLRIVAAWYQLGQDDIDHWPRDNTTLWPNFSSWTRNETGLLHPGSDDGAVGVVNKFVAVSDGHDIIARQVAEEGIVLVKNEDGMLPLSKNGFDLTQSKERKIRIGVFGEDGFDNPKGPNSCDDRACNDYTLGSGWGSGAVEFPYLVSPMTALRNTFVNDSVEFFEWPSNKMSGAADRGAVHSDICFVFITSDAGEGFVAWKDVKGDRNNLYPQKGGDALVKRVAEKCGNNGHGPVVVVLHSVGPTILEEWIDHPNVKGVLLAHLPGQESGNALASIVFGDVSPSGHLPYTIARHEDDYGLHSKILKTTKSLVPQQNFTDHLYIDYRHFDTYDITPRYEFGYGLSYTSFNISSFEVHSLVPERFPFPGPRPNPEPTPPIDRRTPSASDALYPTDFSPINKFIYPWIHSTEEAKPSPTPYPYPSGYKEMRHPSSAGGGQGGNPDLYAPLALIDCTIDNTGFRDGAVVLQVYVSFPTNVTDSLGQHVDFPPRQLRGFEKLHLEPANYPGSRADISFELTRRDLSYWDVGAQNWVFPLHGDFVVSVGYSSRQFDPIATGVIPFPPGRKGHWDSGRWVPDGF